MARAQIPTRVFDVRQYGATGDGVTLDTDAINRSIAAADSAGGGTVFFPAGKYLSFSIRLKSRITLWLDSGCEIIAAEPPADLSAGYDAPEPNPSEAYQDFGHSHWHNSLIWGENLEDITICGAGRIFGRGLSKGRDRRDLLPEERFGTNSPDVSLPSALITEIAGRKPGKFGYPGHDTLPAGVGNKAIALVKCRNVTFRDFTIYHGGHFAILGTDIQNWTVDNVKLDTNRDGIDVDGCTNVRISNCSVNSPYDDGICLKSSYALGRMLPTDNITIANCFVSGFDEGTLLDGARTRRAQIPNGVAGRIKCGTESNGSFRNITISGCVLEYSRGLALESVDGAQMEDISIVNTTMRDIVNAPIFIRLGARLRAPDDSKVGTARRIKINTLIAQNVAASSGILISGVPHHPIEDLSLSNIHMEFAGGGTVAQGARVLPEQERDYPEPSYFGVVPAWGLFLRHAVNFSADQVVLRTVKDDHRPAVILDDAANVRFDRVSFQQTGGVPMFVLQGVHGFTLRSCPGQSDLQSDDLIEKRQL